MALNFLAGHFFCFNPRLPCGRRLTKTIITAVGTGFNPRLPCGRRLDLSHIHRLDDCVSIHASRVGGDKRLWALCKINSSVSIHASRVGGDERNPSHCQSKRASIHASRVGGNGVFSFVVFGCLGYNPRRPCGRRPRNSDDHHQTRLFQSTPPVWEATNHIFSLPYFFMVSIHASRVGGDPGSTTTNTTS